MLSSLVLILVLLIPCLLLKLGLFESFVALLIAVTLTFPYLEVYTGLNIFTALLLGFALAVLLGLFTGFTNPLKSYRDIKFLPIALTLTCFGLNYLLLMRWPDFFPMGERLRDYSLLAATIKDPLNTREPWLSGYPLMYYKFWYQFGALLAKSGNLPTWQVYHLLVAFALALYCGAISAFNRTVLNFKNTNSVLIALLIAYGSNVAGVFFWLQGERGWWDPSRVIKGAINEFPVWSFLLGDAHPHYLNLAFAPWAFTIIYLLLNSKSYKLIEKLVLFFGLSLLLVIFTKLSNPWELPLIGVSIFLFFIAWAISSIRKYNLNMGKEENSLSINPELLGFRSINNIYYIAANSIAAFFLFNQQANVIAGDNPISFVKGAISNSTVSEIFLHWGFPIILSIVAITFRQREFIDRLVFVTFILAATILNSATTLIFLLLLFHTSYLLKLITKRTSFSLLYLEAIGIISLGLILLPEIAFLDDPYGGESERMNTIFKIYTFVWFPFHIWAISSFLTELNSITENLKCKNLINVGIATIASLFLGGFCVWVSFGSGLRTLPNISQYQTEGLETVEKTFLGGKETIRKLRTLPDGTVLEGQKGAYNWSTHVATLAEKTSFLGWANHVGLLTRDYREVNRRERLIEAVYKSTDCVNNKELLLKEMVKYVVLGPLEVQDYGANVASFSCLKQEVNSGSYTIYSVN
jgi:uncharacterized membrane protein